MGKGMDGEDKLFQINPITKECGSIMYLMEKELLWKLMVDAMKDSFKMIKVMAMESMNLEMAISNIKGNLETICKMVLEHK